MGKKLTYLIIHCTATPENMEVTSKDIKKWHTSLKPLGRGWKVVGYSDMIHLNGIIENLRPYNNDGIVDGWEISNGVQGINSISRHVVYVGGMDVDLRYPKDTRTPEQLMSLANYVRHVVAAHPTIKVAGHNQFDDNKACPSFNVPKWLRGIGIKSVNIYEK